MRTKPVEEKESEGCGSTLIFFLRGGGGLPSKEDVKSQFVLTTLPEMENLGISSFLDFLLSLYYKTS